MRKAKYFVYGGIALMFLLFAWATAPVEAAVPKFNADQVLRQAGVGTYAPAPARRPVVVVTPRKVQECRKVQGQKTLRCRDVD